MKRVFIISLMMLSFLSLFAEIGQPHIESKDDISIVIIPDTEKDVITTNIYCGYSLSKMQELTHGINLGFTISVNQVMFGADFKISCNLPAVNNHSWGGYGIIGWGGNVVSVGALIGGISRYTGYRKDIHYNTYGVYNSSYDTERINEYYTTGALFDGGIMMSFNIPNYDMIGTTITISSTYYTPFSICFGIYFQRY